MRSGTTAFEHVFGTPFYDYLDQQPELAGRFGQLMVGAAPVRYHDVTAVYDFSAVGVLVDVGAGHGGLTSMILADVPAMRAVLFDLPEVVAGARERLTADGFRGRCQFVAGSAFDAVPGGGDLYLLANVLNNWRDSDAERILHACREAMSEASTLVLIDVLDLPPSQRTEASPGVFAGVALMAVATRGGGSRSEAQWRALLNKTGFELNSVRHLSRNHLFEALPI